MHFSVNGSEDQGEEKSEPEVFVNGFAISASDIGAELQHHPADDINEALHSATEALVVRQLMLQRAQTIKLIDEDNVSEQAREEAIEALLDKEMELPEADEEACEHYYEANKEKFVSPPLIEASHILFACEAKDFPKRETQKALAQSVLEQLKRKPGLFNKLAKEHSDCPSKETEGNLGQLSKGSTVEEFEKQVFKLPEGLAKYPIETRYGYHLVKVNHRIDGKQLPYEAVKAKVAEYLNNQVYVRAVSQYIAFLASEAEISGFDFDGAENALVQ